jgi:hypothetical protein
MTSSAVIGFAMKKSIFRYHRRVGMKGIWSRLFWKIILPLVVAFAQAIVRVLFGRIPTFGISPRSSNISVYVSAATFVCRVPGRGLLEHAPLEQGSGSI